MQRQHSERRLIVLSATLGSLAPGLARAAVPQLTLGTGARAPLASTAGQPGFVEELVRAACKRIGYGLNVAQLPVERALTNANAGVEDGDLYRTGGFEKDYPNLTQVPHALIDQEFVALSRKPDVQVGSWADLARYSVAHITGFKVLERKLEGATNVTTVRNGEVLLEMLASGRADVILHNRWVGLWEARKAGLAVRMQVPPLITVPMYMYLHRRHAALVPRLSAALDELRRDGTWQRLYDQILKPLEATR